MNISGLGALLVIAGVAVIVVFVHPILGKSCSDFTKRILIHMEYPGSVLSISVVTSSL